MTAAPQHTAPDDSTSTPDPRPLFARALDQAGRLVEAVDPTDLDRPTPCTEFTVRRLLGHLVAVEHRVAHIARGGQPADLPSTVDGVADDQWARAWAEGRTELAAALAEPDVLDRIFAHPAGAFPARQALFAYLSEVTAHGWDLAMALGRTDELDQAIAAACVEPVRRFLPEQPRGGPIPFGPVVAVPEDAAPYDRLAGWYGRNPTWLAA